MPNQYCERATTLDIVNVILVCVSVWIMFFGSGHTIDDRNAYIYRLELSLKRKCQNKVDKCLCCMVFMVFVVCTDRLIRRCINVETLTLICSFGVCST